MASAPPTSWFSRLRCPAHLPAPLRFSHGVAPAAARAGFPGGEILPGLDLSIRLHSSSHQLPYAGLNRRFPSAATAPAGDHVRVDATSTSTRYDVVGDNFASRWAHFDTLERRC